MKRYKKYWEYKITLASASDDEFTRQMFDPRLNSICVCKDHYIANMRFRKNIRRPNRIRNVKHTLECWNRHLQKKERKIRPMKIPYITCPDCGSQLLNPKIEDNMLHFVCSCGSEVWYDGEDNEE